MTDDAPQRWSLGCILALGVAACGGHGVEPPPAPPTVEVAPQPPGVLADLRASVRAPARLEYDPQSLGVPAPFVAIRLENAGPRTVALPGVRARFVASRNGVEFSCNTHVETPTGAVEPSHLEPGRSFTFERLLDCAMPLPGRYDVRVSVQVGRSRDGTEEAVASLYAGSFQVEVTSAGNGPRPIDAAGLLYASMIGSPVTLPIAQDEWAKGAYRVAIAVINAGPRVASLGPSGVSLLVYRVGSTVPCTTGRQPLDEPDTLAPGAVHVVQVPVTCAPAEEGQYRVVARFSGGGANDVEIGRFGLFVTRNPYYEYVPRWPRFPPPPRLP